MVESIKVQGILLMTTRNPGKPVELGSCIPLFACFQNIQTVAVDGISEPSTVILPEVFWDVSVV